jgi:xylan 1,4-beta-xylosidase
LLFVPSKINYQDVFEEGGLPLVEFNDIYGIMTIHGIPKPAWRAFQLLHAHAGDQRLRTSSSNSTRISAFATSNSTEGGAAVATTASYSVFLGFWGNPDATQPPAPDRTVNVYVRHGAGVAPTTGMVYTINSTSTNPRAVWEAMGQPAVPNSTQMTRLMAASESVSESTAVRSVNATTSVITITMSENTAAVVSLA